MTATTAASCQSNINALPERIEKPTSQIIFGE
jgi:hypothetical protein